MVTLFARHFCINVLIAENRKKKDIDKDIAPEDRLTDYSSKLPANLGEKV